MDRGMGHLAEDDAILAAVKTALATKPSASVR